MAEGSCITNAEDEILICSSSIILLINVTIKALTSLRTTKTEDLRVQFGILTSSFVDWSSDL
jgi:hypothetical protein